MAHVLVDKDDGTIVIRVLGQWYILAPWPIWAWGWFGFWYVLVVHKTGAWWSVYPARFLTILLILYGLYHMIW